MSLSASNNNDSINLLLSANNTNAPILNWVTQNSGYNSTNDERINTLQNNLSVSSVVINGLTNWVAQNNTKYSNAIHGH